MKSFDKGFTLMEIIVVVVIISLLMGFAIPKMGSFLDEDKSKKSIMSFISLLKELRNNALIKKQDIFLVIDPQKDIFKVAGPGGNNPPKSLKDIDIKGVKRPGADFLSMEESYIRFYKKGYNDPFILVLQNRSNLKVQSIVVHPFLPNPDIYSNLNLSEDGF